VAFGLNSGVARALPRYLISNQRDGLACENPLKWAGVRTEVTGALVNNMRARSWGYRTVAPLSQRLSNFPDDATARRETIASPSRGLRSGVSGAVVD
jgi:hypothetical protein